MHPTGKKARFFGAAPLAAALLATGLSAPSFAYTTPLPPSLAPEVLSETVPTAFAGFELETADYEVQWQGAKPAGIEARLLPGTVQWVRVADVLALPRARLRIDVSGADPGTGRVLNAGFSQNFAPLSGGSPADGTLARAEIPIALISGDRNPVEISYLSHGEPVTARLWVQFKPRAGLREDRVFYDASCSRFGVHATGTAQSSHARGWAYIGCRVAEVEGAEHRTSSLEAWVYWDGVGQELLVGGVPTAASSISVWPLRLRSEPGHVQLAVPGGGDEMRISYSTPDNFHRGFLGVGLGPYWDHFTGGGDSLSTPAPVLTLYGSYFITETLRVVSFDATTLDSHLTTDVGIYLNTEYVHFYDRRIVINLLLGAHAIGFSSQGQYFFQFGAPQGVEVLFIDFIKKAHTLNTGFFIYPLINGRSYYNLWLRWGSGRLFGEFNYISWDEVANGQSIHSDSAGISVGMPLARFF